MTYLLCGKLAGLGSSTIAWQGTDEAPGTLTRLRYDYESYREGMRATLEPIKHGFCGY